MRLAHFFTTRRRFALERCRAAPLCVGTVTPLYARVSRDPTEAFFFPFSCSDVRGHRAGPANQQQALPDLL